jgi:phosphatidate cytidylyltransferase
MFITVLIFSTTALLLGALAFAKLNKNASPEKAVERRKKLLSYVVMTFILYSCITYVSWLFEVIAAFLIFIALREILAAARNTGRRPYGALLAAGTILYLFAAFVRQTDKSYILFVYFIIVHFDGFSQVIGESFGKHKLVPKISPGKTWEGLAGGTIVALVAGFTIYGFENPEKTLALVLLIITAGFAGDILASYYKRLCRIKDYSNMIPGHGGVLDRFDSFFMAGAVIEVLQWLYTR